MENYQRSFGLDLVRAIAISLVLISHFVTQVGYLGYLGVELFFVLSGFLIGGILWRNFSYSSQWSKGSIINFWSRRWWRTLPNYYLFLLINLVLAYQGQEFPSIQELVKFIWFGQYLLDQHFGFYSISWSLCIEEWFYLLFPLLLYVINKLGLGSKKTFLWAIIVIFAFSVFFRFYLLYSGTGAPLRTTTLSRLDSIACGVAACYIIKVYNPALYLQYISFYIGALLLMFINALPFFISTSYANLIQNPIVLVALPFTVALMLPVVSTLSRSYKYRLFSIIVEKLSLWSYSLYLVHLPIMWIVYDLMLSYRHTTLGNLMSKFIGLVISFVLSAFLYKYFEVPLLRKRPKEVISQVENELVLSK